MTDEYIAHLSGIYQQEDVAHRYGWTFAHFIKAHESGHYKRIKLYENTGLSREMFSVKPYREESK